MSRTVQGRETHAKAAGLRGGWRRRALGLSIVLTALVGAGPGVSNARTVQSEGRPGELPRFSVDVGAVALDVLVTDRKGRFVPGLKPSDFQVLELGIPRELTFFSAGRTPVTIVLLLDSSASVRSDLLSVQKAARRFTEKLERGDRARIGFFHERVVFGPRFTDDTREHSAMINQMQPQRSTHLYDALVQALEELRSVPKRKALLVFSDGEDQGSQTSMADALEVARRSDVSIYSVGLRGWSAEDGMHTNQHLLDRLAELTGGRTFLPENEKQMLRAFDRIRAELHHQYRMGYVPSGADEGAGGWRDIRVEMPRRKDLVVRSRLGYYREMVQGP